MKKQGIRKISWLKLVVFEYMLDKLKTTDSQMKLHDPTENNKIYPVEDWKIFLPKV